MLTIMDITMAMLTAMVNTMETMMELISKVLDNRGMSNLVGIHKGKIV